MNALRLTLWLDDDPGERHPIRQNLPACCARAATDQVAVVPARSVMNLRLCMSPSISGDAIIATQTRGLIEAEPNEIAKMAGYAVGSKAPHGLAPRSGGVGFTPPAPSSRHRDRICPQSRCQADPAS